MTKSTGRDTSAYQASLDYLFERINYERSVPMPYTKQHYRLNRMRRLLELLGNPQTHAPVIHIAGTKGKGSVAWLMAEALRYSGYHVGLYTSPHLIHLEERFVVDGLPCAPEELTAMVDLLRPVVEELAQSDLGAPTFFELTTALGWLLFRHRNTNVAVIEVGLGGRLDSTNVCEPALCIITSISLDHQQQLGSTIGRIAGEKAGIIKQGIPVVSGATAPEADAVIEHVAYQQGAPLWRLDRDFSSTWTKIDSEASDWDGAEGSGLKSSGYSFGATSFQWMGSEPMGASRERYPLRLLGAHQGRNAALMMASVDVLRKRGWSISEEAVAESLRSTQVTGRTQVVETSPWLIVDTAHNMASIEALITVIQTHFQPRRRILLFSASKDKEYDKMLQSLLTCFDSIILTQFQSNPRAVPLEQLFQLGNDMLQKEPHARPTLHCELLPQEGLAFARRLASKEDLICVAGSFFLAAEILPLVGDSKGVG